MTVASGAPQPRRWSKLLIISLAINLLVVGAVAGAWGTGKWKRPMDLSNGKVLGEPGLGGFVRSLPKERRDVLRKTLDPLRQSSRDQRPIVMRARQDVATALGQTPIEPAQVEHAMENLMVAETAMRKIAIATLVSALNAMTDPERQRFQSWRKQHDHLPPSPPFRSEDASQPNAPVAGQPK